MLEIWNGIVEAFGTIESLHGDAFVAARAGDLETAIRHLMIVRGLSAKIRAIGVGDWLEIAPPFYDALAIHAKAVESVLEDFVARRPLSAASYANAGSFDKAKTRLMRSARSSYVSLGGAASAIRDIDGVTETC